MSLIPSINVILCIAAVLSVLGLLQRRWMVLRMAVLLGWVAPFPGFLIVFVSGAGRITHRLGVLDIVKAIPTLLWPYLYFALPMVGPYCFIVGLVGGGLISRYTCAPAPRWVRPLAIILMSGMAAIPVILLAELWSEWGAAAIVSATLAGATIYYLKGKIFVDNW